MIRVLKVATLILGVITVTIGARPVCAADETNPLVLPTPQEMMKEQELAQQKTQLTDLETRVIKPLLKLYGPDKYGIEALYAKLLDLKKRSASGEDVGLELARLKADGERANQQAVSEQNTASHDQAMLAAQREQLADVEKRWIAPSLQTHGPDKYRAGELYGRLQDLKKRSASGEDIALGLAELKRDAEQEGAKAWEDYKRAQGWK